MIHIRKRRVVITGIGAVSPIGIGREKYWESLKQGVSGIRKVTTFDTSKFSSHLAGYVPDFSAATFLPLKLVRRTDRSTHLAIAATQLALEDAGLKLDSFYQKNIHVIMGTALSGHLAYSDQLLIYHMQGPQRVSPFAAVSCFSDACSGQINIFFGLKGPSQTICAGCASSSNAISDAYKRIQWGEADMVIAGGTDAPLSEEVFCGFCQSKVLTQKDNSTPSPFDKNRDGTVLSEGSGIVIVESLESAIRRDAKIYGEILGCASTTDAYQMAGAEPSGEERIRAARLALEDAGVSPDEVDYVNAHGTGTHQNDKNETHVIKEVFGKHAQKLLVSSVKSMIGHVQGGCGVLEIIACLMALTEGVVPPTINYQTFDEECDLNCVPNRSIQKKINLVVKNAFAFGGKNTVIVLKAYDGH